MDEGQVPFAVHAMPEPGEPGERRVAEPRDLRFVLRDATDAAHRRLDAGFAAHDLTRRADYVAFLSAMSGPFWQIEGWLDGIEAAFLPTDWPVRRRFPELRADLEGLGLAFDPAAGAESGAERPSEAEAPGLLYVLEGSRLGGQVLLRQVVTSIDPQVRANARFLSHGEGQRLWPSFAAWLGARPAEGHEAAIRGAHRAFALFAAAQSTR